MRISVYKTTSVVFLLVILWLATSHVQAELNPDWIAYMKIFEDGGWLLDDNRDLGFLAIIWIFKAVFGNNYDFFRHLLIGYFLFFALFFFRGSIFPFKQKGVYVLQWTIAILALLLIRFTVQIREGLALTFLLFGLGLIIRRSQKDNLLDLKVDLWCVPFFFAAFLVHSGMLPFLILMLLTLLLPLFGVKSRISLNNAITIIKYAGYSLLAFFPVVTSVLLNSNLLYINKLDLSEIVSLSPAKITYWLIYGLIIRQVVKKIRLTYVRLPEPTAASAYFRLLGLIITIFYLLVIECLLMQLPGAVAASVIRFLNVSVCIGVIILAFNAKNPRLVILSSLFIIVDQVRTIIESLQVMTLL
jgi:hypothetical protein